MFGFFLCTEKSLKMQMHQLCVFYWSEMKYYINKIRYIKHVALLLLFARTLVSNKWMNLNCKVTTSLYSPQQMWSHGYVKMSIKSVILVSSTLGQIQAENMVKAICLNLSSGGSLWRHVTSVCFLILIIQVSYHTRHIDFAAWLCHLL